MIMPLFYNGKGIIAIFTLVGLYWLWKSWDSRAWYIFEVNEENANEDQKKEE